MTTAEKEDRITHMQEQLLELASIMSKSDAHASKCIKLGLSYKDTYPNEYNEYTQAREDYNQLEKDLTALEGVDIEEEIIDEQQEKVI